MSYRYDYAIYRTRKAAERALLDMFASGEVSPGEFPEIIEHGSRFIITLQG
jgi:hypothetical protein